jgi:hypothetical protein
VALFPAHLPFSLQTDGDIVVCPISQTQPSFAVPLQLSSFPATHVSFAAGMMLHGP